MRANTVALATLGLAAALTAAQPLASLEWSSFHGLDGQTRAWPSRIRTRTNGTLKWSFDADGPALSPAVSADGTVYFLTCQSTVYAVHGSNGTLRWRNALSTQPESCFDMSPSIGSNGLVYVFAVTYTLYALNSSTGSIVWSRKSDLQLMMSTPALDGNGGMFAGFDVSVCAFHGATGAERWCNKLFAAVDGPVTLDWRGAMYAVEAYGLILAYNATTGKQLWTSEQDAMTYKGPVLGDSGMLFVGAGANLYALSVYDGAVNCTYGTQGLIEHAPTFADGIVYFDSDDGNAYAVYASNGSLKRSFPTTDFVSSLAIGGDGTVYMGSYNGHLYAVDGASGQLRWDFAAAVGSMLSPAIGPDGTVYVTSCVEGNSLYAFVATVVSRHAARAVAGA